jgi:hypothetical protein
MRVEIMNKSFPVCTLEQVEILKNQQFSNTQPSTLLKDFNALLDFVGETGIAVSEKTQLLAMNQLADLNQRLSSPLQVKLKRPQQKSYPHINGLYLLLRCSGLANLDGDGKKIKLMLDKNMLAQWYELNPTEQYFFLLQTFYYRANTGIIGEAQTRFERTAFFECLGFLKKELKEGFYDTQNSRHYIDRLRYTGFYNLALLELFGFITIEFDKNNEESWPVSKIYLTAFGNAMLSYLLQGDWILKHEFFPDFSPNNKNKIRWEDELKKLIPAWKNSLVTENNRTIAAQNEGCYVFKVSLEKASCKLGVPSNLSLEELAHGILNVFDFDSDHLYEFSYKNQSGLEERIDCPRFDLFGNSEEDYDDFDDDDEELTTDKCSVSYLPLYKGMTFTFLFDFGDNWEFKIQVLQMPSPELHFDDLTVLEKKGTPPEQYPDYDEDDE